MESEVVAKSKQIKNRLSQIENPSCEVGPICELIETLRKVGLDNPDAELNTISISDGKGGRILL